MLSSKVSHGFSESCFIPKLNLDNSSSNFKTLTFIFSPKLSISDGEFILVHEMSVM